MYEVDVKRHFKRSLELGDVICLDSKFVRWLKEEKKIEVKGDYNEGQEETATVMMKDGNLYFRLPYCDKDGDEVLRMRGGTEYEGKPKKAEKDIAIVVILI